jgi:hypothetical protein
MRVGSGEFTYEWHENWASIPDTEGGRQSGRTHGVVASKTGDILVFSQAQPAVLRFGPDGRLKNAWGDRFAGAHGMTLVEEDGVEYLWLTDQNSAEVVKTTLDGKTVMNLQRPPHPVYAGGVKYVPTWVAVNEKKLGGNGDIWVADGYGSSFIHRYDARGAYIASINGTEGMAGAFACPHGIRFISRGGAAPELYVADRGNKRIQVYDANGTFKRVFGADFLTSPDMFAVHGDLLLVPELLARITILDRNDKLLTYLGENAQTVDVKGWPNHPKELIVPGKFNSPHGMTADAAGNLYVVEWIVGGRISKLERVK